MNKAEFLKVNKLQFNSFLSTAAENIWTAGEIPNRVICREQIVEPIFSMPSVLTRFKKGLCIECEQPKGKAYSDIFANIKNSDCKFIELYGYANGYCKSCAEKHATLLNVKTHDNDLYTRERVPMGLQCDKVVTRYVSEGWPASIDPIYDVDCEKVEGVENWSNADFSYGLEN